MTLLFDYQIEFPAHIYYLNRLFELHIIHTSTPGCIV